MQTIELVGSAGLAGSSLGFVISPKGSAIYEDDREKQLFKNLQSVINTYLAKFLPNAKRLKIDGQLGSRTMTARNAIMAHVRGRGLMGLRARDSITDLANNATLDTLAIKGFTIGQGVPKKDLPQEQPPPAQVAPQERVTPEQQLEAQDIAQGKRQGASPYAVMGVVGAIALIGVGVMVVRRRAG